MSLTFTRDILRTVVAQICQTIGWHAIHATPLELMVDFLHKNLEEICKVTHRYTEQFGQTIPNLDHLGLAFQDLGIVLQELEDYTKNVEAVPCIQQVPQYPIGRETHLNFLKPGSHEVVHRPVHVHEHLPPMHPDLEAQNKQVPLLMDTPILAPSDISTAKSSIFKRPGDPIDSPALKRARLLMEEEGRPLREISSVMMTTSGFISPAREGKLPESRAPLIPSDSRTVSPVPASFPTVPPEVKSEKKMKKSPPKKVPLGLKKLDKENNKKKETRDSARVVGQAVDDSRVKKLASMKELTKLKALKGGAKKVPHMPPEACHGNPKDFTSYIQNLSKANKPPKNKPEKHVWPTPGPSTKVSHPFEKSKEASIVIEGKLSTEPDKQKLNIFKKISKVKEEKSEKINREDLQRDSRDNSPGLVIDEVVSNHGQKEARLAQIEECIEAVVLQQSQPTPIPSTSSQGFEKCTNVSLTTNESNVNDYEEGTYVSETYSPPGTPSTPKTPEIPMKLDKTGDKKRKKEKVKSKTKMPIEEEVQNKKAKIETIDLEPMERPKTPEARTNELLAPIFPFYPHFPPAPGLIPPPIMHPFFPSLQLPFPTGHIVPTSSLPHPAMPNLPMPPPCFMQPRNIEPPTSPEVSIIAINPEPSISVEKEKPTEKKTKEHKKDKKEDKKTKKKKEKKEKSKSKEKGEKKKDDKKDRDKSKEKKEKKEKKKEREREEKAENSVPKITLKLGASSPRPPTPDSQTRKIVIKPVIKKEEAEAVVEPTRAPSPELARFSALITRPPKQKVKPSVETPEPMPQSSSGFRPKTPETSSLAAHQYTPHVPGVKSEAKSKEMTKKPLFGNSTITKETVAFYHDDAGNKIWICPACKGPDDGSPMIGCDDCDAWYHWVCVGIQVPPDDKEDWYCRECIQRKEELFTADKKKKPRKKKV